MAKISLDGYIYEGDVVNGIPHGQGKYYSPIGSLMYEGGWVN